MSDETVDEGADIAWWLKWLTRIIGAIGGVSSAIGGILGMRFLNLILQDISLKFIVGYFIFEEIIEKRLKSWFSIFLPQPVMVAVQ